MNPEDNTDQYAGAADQLRENTQVAQYEAQENTRLQNKKIKAVGIMKRAKPATTGKQLSLSTFLLMFGVAIFFDVISLIMNFIPIVGGLLQLITITPVATLTFFIWLKMHGINFTKGPRGFLLILTVIIGFIPVINALPEWSSFVLGLYLSGTKISTGMQKSLNKVRGK
jgi:hypothetical protein